ncbi:MAG: hypothetical protein JWO25_3802 [Alphaproteobacteria bacterium]|nr:hypothetical protein [Alphaproteobacteria bacterium]MDB5722861.1 hypothetical protein [Alphaproteobacteria bacterium]
MAVRTEIAYLLILLMLATAILVPILLGRAKKRERRRANQPIRLVEEQTEPMGD